MRIVSMSEIVKIVSELELKIRKLIEKTDDLERKNQALNSEISFYKNKFQETGLRIEQLENQIETLKTINALLGSEDYKRENKIRINSIIREIDYCIAQLSD